MAEYKEQGPENLFGEALNQLQREKLCKFLNIPSDSTDRQIVWGYMGLSRIIGSQAPRELKEDINKVRVEKEGEMTEERAVQEIIELWGGENEFSSPKE